MNNNDNLSQKASRLSAYLDKLGADADVPPPDVLARNITPDDVKQWPEYFILGAGRDIASRTDCGHGYFLTDSCSICP